MSTLTTYRTATKLRGYDALSDATVDEAIQEARRRIFMARRWSWQESSSAALSTAANVATVSLTSLTTLAHVDAIRLSDTAGPLRVEFTPWPELRDMQDRCPETGDPFVWSRRGSNLVFYPTPSRVLTVTVEFALAAVDLAASPAVDIIPDKNRDLVTYAAAIPLSFRQNQFDKSSAADQYFVKVLLPQHGGQDDVEQRQNSSQMRTGWWGS